MCGLPSEHVCMRCWRWWYRHWCCCHSASEDYGDDWRLNQCHSMKVGTLEWSKGYSVKWVDVKMLLKLVLSSVCQLSCWWDKRDPISVCLVRCEDDVGDIGDVCLSVKWVSDVKMLEHSFVSFWSCTLFMDLFVVRKKKTIVGISCHLYCCWRSCWWSWWYFWRKCWCSC